MYFEAAVDLRQVAEMVEGLEAEAGRHLYR